ncbi:MAG: hypothetical protein LBR44_11740 [Clostridiales Family XIII bacterium]|nr:hypothetical protein [Clostridiales Family XIII bacterium]
MLESLRRKMPEAAFHYYAQDPGGDGLLILCACEVGCATRPAFDGPVTFVTPGTVNRFPAPEEGLEDRVAEELRRAEGKEK